MQWHEIKRTLTETVWIPDHAKRKESNLFKKNKKRLRDDGHFKCYICGSINKLQVHHFICEWSLEQAVDYTLFKQLTEEWDIYGYGRLLKNQAIESVDDIRNLMVLCTDHHVGSNKNGVSDGIHYETFPIWIFHKIHKKDLDNTEEHK